MKKLVSAALTVSFFTSMTIMPAMALDPSALPSLNNAQNANVTNRSGYTTNVEIKGGNGSVGLLNWNSFNVGSDARVNFEFTNQNQTALNKVGAAGGISEINGLLTSSGIGQNTGKVILINPNGVLFGSNANINLNSFTVSTIDGSYNAKNQTLNLMKDSQAKAGDIKVKAGAEIYADKNVSFIAPNIVTYAGSKIATNVNAAGNGVKLITADGVNFVYDNSGAAKTQDINMASDAMYINLNGEIEAGNLEINHAATSGKISLNNAALKATKAVAGNDGNIYLKSANDIEINNSTVEGNGNIDVSADKDITVKNSELNAGGHLYSRAYYTTTIDNSKLTAQDYLDAASMGKTTVQNSSTVKGKNVALAAVKDVTLNNSTVESTDSYVNLYGENTVLTNNAKINSKGEANFTADGGSTLFYGNSKVNAEKDINVKGSVFTTFMNTHLTSNGNVNVNAKVNGTMQGNTTINAKGDINLTTEQEHVVLEDVTLESGNNITLTAGNISAIQGNSKITAKGKLSVNGKNKAQVTKGSIIANEFEIKGNDIWLKTSDIQAAKSVDIEAVKNNVTIDNGVKIITNGQASIKAANDVKANSAVDLANSKTNIYAGRDIKVKLNNVGKRENGITMEAGRNLTAETNGTLSVSRLVAKNGDLTLTADKVIAGNPKVTDDYLRTQGDSADRAYISVKNGKFTSNTKNDEYKVTDSADPVDKSQGFFNQKHHIEYGNGNEKILLINNRPYEGTINPPQSAQEVLPAVDETQAQILNKLPKQPESFHLNTNITNEKTNITNVLAAASQVEVDSEEE